MRAWATGTLSPAGLAATGVTVTPSSAAARVSTGAAPDPSTNQVPAPAGCCG